VSVRRSGAGEYCESVRFCGDGSKGPTGLAIGTHRVNGASGWFGETTAAFVDLKLIVDRNRNRMARRTFHNRAIDGGMPEMVGCGAGVQQIVVRKPPVSG